MIFQLPRGSGSFSEEALYLEGQELVLVQDQSTGRTVVSDSTT